MRISRRILATSVPQWQFQLIDLLKSDGYQLKKCTSNYSELLNPLSADTWRLLHFPLMSANEKDVFLIWVCGRAYLWGKYLTKYTQTSHLVNNCKVVIHYHPWQNHSQQEQPRVDPNIVTRCTLHICGFNVRIVSLEELILQNVSNLEKLIRIVTYVSFW